MTFMPYEDDENYDDYPDDEFNNDDNGFDPFNAHVPKGLEALAYASSKAVMSCLSGPLRPRLDIVKPDLKVRTLIYRAKQEDDSVKKMKSVVDKEHPIAVSALIPCDEDQEEECFEGLKDSLVKMTQREVEDDQLRGCVEKYFYCLKELRTKAKVDMFAVINNSTKLGSDLCKAYKNKNKLATNKMIITAPVNRELSSFDVELGLKCNEDDPVPSVSAEDLDWWSIADTSILDSDQD